jgi:glycosyltransferase involved in cell wall biosynthesis
MADEEETITLAREARPLRIVHVMRAPVGGLFRHVVDLARAQAAQGHLVGIIADSATGGARAAQTLDELAPSLAFGVTRMEMRRQPHWTDPLVAHRVARLLNEFDPDVVHGHGAKGGLYARLPALIPGYPRPARRILRVYTPHGGSLHFLPTNLANRLLLYVEKALEGVTDFIPFESEFAKKRFVENIGLAHALAMVVHNGVGPQEFEPAAPDAEAADFLYVGEWRRYKGVDTLIEALAIIGARKGTTPSLALVGSGPDEAALRVLAEKSGVSRQMTFHAPMSGREAFRLGRVIVAPSRAESLPYIVLEAIAARVPIVATNVGGVPEIFGPHATWLAPCDDPEALARAMSAMMAMDAGARFAQAEEMADYVRQHFNLAGMAEDVLRGYREAMRAAARRESRTGNALPRHI